MIQRAGELGQIVILNGAPRSGKSSIAAAMQLTMGGVWLNIGVDLAMRATPNRLLPGIGLRPGGERPDIEAILPALFAALYESVAAHSRLGIDVVVDIGHHDGYSRPLGIFADCARRLSGLPALLVGVYCPIEIILQRRRDTGWVVGSAPGGDPDAPVLLWQTAVHRPGVYDFKLDTSVLSPEECAAAIGRRIEQGPTGTALGRIAAGRFVESDSQPP